jgi:hypothetical protein
MAMIKAGQLEQEAKRLWMQLQYAQYKAMCDADWVRCDRIHHLIDQAFWRLVRRTCPVCIEKS